MYFLATVLLTSVQVNKKNIFIYVYIYIYAYVWFENADILAYKLSLVIYELKITWNTIYERICTFIT